METQLKATDRVRCPITEEEGEVFGVCKEAIAVMWDAGGTTLFNHGELIVLPPKQKEGEHVQH